jgi:hypothetical protein
MRWHLLYLIDKTMEKVKIVKIGEDGTPKPPPTGGKKKKSMRTYPHGVLKGGKTARQKITAVRDPAKAPPINGKHKSTLRILTEKGAEKRRQKIKKTVRAMPETKVRAVLKASGLPVSDKTPSHIAKEILEGGMEAGMIVVR